VKLKPITVPQVYVFTLSTPVLQITVKISLLT